ncbi:unnamed protein product [Protopolystoma xenopodis]|uniref:Uncharacterized protein n=1 Tax=Protopolystoma xenopodis TaxID=117903 RepID=A0A448WNG8_9PLAT|nr:unnamed protein product [Protopolystoma xenopodis]
MIYAKHFPDVESGKPLASNLVQYSWEIDDAISEPASLFGSQFADEVSESEVVTATGDSEAVSSSLSQLQLLGLRAGTWRRGRCLANLILARPSIVGQQGISERRTVHSLYFTSRIRQDAEASEPQPGLPITVNGITFDPFVRIKVDGVDTNNDTVGLKIGGSKTLTCHSIGT